MEIYAHNDLIEPPQKGTPPPRRDGWLRWCVPLLAAVCVLLIVAVSVLAAVALKKDKPAAQLDSAGLAALVRPQSVEVLGSGTNGSGVVVQLTDDGGAYLVTNFHVISGNLNSDYSPAVRFYGQNDFEYAPIVGYEPYHDVAVLQVASVPAGVTAATVEQSVSALLGASIMTVGNDMGKGVSAYTGIVSNPSKMLLTQVQPSGTGAYKGVPVYQITAPVNGGMSGGGLFSRDGRLLGINTYQTTSFSEISGARPVDGVAYSVPSTIVWQIFTEVLYAKSSGQTLPVAVDRVEISARMDGNEIATNSSRNPVLDLTGLRIMAGWQGEGLTVVDGTSSNVNAPILAGDVIVAVGETAVAATPDYAPLFATLLRYTGDDSRGEESLRMTVMRAGKAVTVRFYNLYLKRT